MRTLTLNLFPFWPTRVEVSDSLRKHFSDVTHNWIVYKWSRHDKQYYKDGDYEILADIWLVRRWTAKYRTVDTNELFVSRSWLIRTADTNEYYKNRENLVEENGIFATSADYFIRLREEQERRRREEAERELTRPYSTCQSYFADLSEGADVCVWLEIERGWYLTKKQTEAFSEWKIYWDTGWEYCTPILDIDKAVEYLSQPEFACVFDFRDWSDIGWHIHISDRKKSSSELYFSICQYRPILWAIYPERARKHRCSKDGNPENKMVDMNYGWEFGTVEVRIFPALNSLEQAKFRIWLLKFFTSNPCETKQEALDIINEKSIEFLSILDIVYKTIKKKQAILTRIIEAFEVEPPTHEKVLNYLNEQCRILNK